MILDTFWLISMGKPDTFVQKVVIFVQNHQVSRGKPGKQWSRGGPGPPYTGWYQGPHHARTPLTPGTPRHHPDHPYHTPPTTTTPCHTGAHCRLQWETLQFTVGNTAESGLTCHESGLTCLGCDISVKLFSQGRSFSVIFSEILVKSGQETSWVFADFADFDCFYWFCQNCISPRRFLTHFGSFDTTGLNEKRSKRPAFKAGLRQNCHFLMKKQSILDIS